MAVKIIRQPKKIVLIGAPSSAAANAAGCEAAPAALRAAGLAARLEQIGYEVSDAGDIAVCEWRADDNTPRARNAAATVRSLELLQPLVEKAVKSGALPVILGGDCTVTMAALAGIRRYHKEVSLIWCDSDADLNTPATTPSGFLHGMAVAHIAGQGAPELVRFCKQPPLVREPDIALFGLSRTDPGEQQWLDASPMRKFAPEEIREVGAAAAAEAALERIHIFKRQWALHFDVDVLHKSEMPATYYPSANGLRREEFAEALAVFAGNPNLAAVTLAAFVPAADGNGAAAARLIELFAGAMAARYKKLILEPEAEKAAEEAKAAEAKEVQEEKAEKASATRESREATVPVASAPEPDAPEPAALATDALAESDAETAAAEMPEAAAPEAQVAPESVAVEAGPAESQAAPAEEAPPAATATDDATAEPVSDAAAAASAGDSHAESLSEEKAGN